MASVSPLQRAFLSGAPLVALLTFAHLANDAFGNILPVFLPTLQAQLGVGEAVLATFVAVIAITANVMQAVMGLFTDRWGRRKAAALGLLVTSSVLPFVPLASNATVLIVLLIVGGLGSAIFHPGAVSLARDASERKSLVVSIFSSGGSAGAAIMPVIALFVLRTFGASYVPWLGVIGIVTAAVLFLKAPPEAPTHPHARPRIFEKSLIFGPVGLLTVAGILRALAFVSFLNAMPLFLVHVRGFASDAPILGTTLLVYNLTAALGAMIMGALDGRFNRITLLVVSMVLAVPVLALTLVLPAGGLLFYVAVGLGGALTNSSVPLLVVSAQDLAPNHIGAASGMLMGFTWGTAGVIYIAFGALQQFVGLQPALLIAFVFLIPAAALTWFVLKRHRPAPAAR